MLRKYIEEVLGYILINVPDDEQEIFRTIKVKKEIVNDEQREEIDKTTNQACESRNTNGSNVKGSKEVSTRDNSIDETSNAEEVKAVVSSTVVREKYEKVLTPTGHRFVNTMLDLATCKNVSEQTMNGEESADAFSFPPIKLVKIIDESTLYYYNKQGEVNRVENGLLVDMPLYDLNNIIFGADNEGEPYETMHSVEFKRCWEAIVLADKSKIKGLSVNTKLKKEVKYFDDINVAYCNGKLDRKLGKSVTVEETTMAYLQQPEWNIPRDIFLTSAEEFGMTELQRKIWLSSPLGTSSNGPKQGKSNGKNNAKFNKVRAKTKAQAQAKSSNDGAEMPVNDQE